MIGLAACAPPAATPTAPAGPAATAPARTASPIASPPPESATAPPVQPTPTGSSDYIPWPGEDPAYTQARADMVRWTIAARDVDDPAVIRAMATVPRHEFVVPQYLSQAYADHPLPIGYGQTISQPYIVALMTQLLELDGSESVLEIGTGSAYQAAVLAELLPEVYTVEIIPELAQAAGERLARLGYASVHAAQADGYYGWEEHAPYDAIIVTAAPDHLPQPLAAQVKEGGIIVIPIGPPGGYQALWKFVKQAGELTAFRIADVSFVPLTGGP